MLEHVARSQRNKLKLEKLSIPSTEILPVQYSMEQTTGYPHRPPLLRLQSRRTSVSMDDVVRRTSSASSSPDSNLLTVQGNLPGRRHSDNTIQPPRILVAPASPDGNLKRGASAGMLPIRRHSGGQDNRFNSWTPRVVTPNFNIEFFTPTRPGARRYSAAAVCATDLQRNAAQMPGANQQASSILQQIGTGMVNCSSSI
ncbi:hypothetical protein AVEN_16307-1 [Araneus ventricosus]|uniref:Uncharacterized protein n=1 Tax=Araneus ventricosus TaxID=182803 RepID=A0A4Y2LKA0_ARAVE|nr:hypothetical protein AVEN_16307-1 [Araneus ventricosus]